MSKQTRNNKLHRKIWSSVHGTIPKDSFGRSMEIHHINGNHNDNRIENLKLVTIEEHYDIHYSQRDWGACQAISKRMRLSPEENSKLCSELVNKRVAEGTHNWITKPYLKGKTGVDHPRYGLRPANAFPIGGTPWNKNVPMAETQKEKLRVPKTESHKLSLRKPKSHVPRFRCLIDDKEMTGSNMSQHFKRNYPDKIWKDFTIKV